MSEFSMTEVTDKELLEATVPELVDYTLPEIRHLDRVAARSLVEIARRLATSPIEGKIIRGPEDVARFSSDMSLLEAEEFRVIMLNMAARVIGAPTIARGGLASCVVEPRAVFRPAILASAASIICVHNHPSGNTEPSSEDITITKQLVEVGVTMGIPVRDHVIIAGGQFCSLARRGII